MGREIKFRAWDSNKKRMYSAELLEPDMFVNSLGKAVYPVEHGCDGVEMREDRNMELMQYTGLKDKNGTEIYEGDLCQDGEKLYEIKWVEECAKWGAKVIKSEFVLVRGLTFPLQGYVTDGTLECVFEVIGNLYENPEFLQK